MDVVEADHQQREGRALLLAGLDHLVDTVEQQVAIGQAGQVVVVGEVLEFGGTGADPVLELVAVAPERLLGPFTFCADAGLSATRPALLDPL